MGVHDTGTWMTLVGYNDVGHLMPEDYADALDPCVDLLTGSPAHAAWWAGAGRPQVEVFVEFFVEGFAPFLVLPPGRVEVRPKRRVTHVTLSSTAVVSARAVDDLHGVVREDLCLVLEGLRVVFGLGPVPAWPGGDPAGAVGVGRGGSAAAACDRVSGGLTGAAQEVRVVVEQVQVVVEVHVPLVEVDVAEGHYPYPWISDLDEYLEDLEEQGELEVFDHSEDAVEEEGAAGERVFYVTGRPEAALLDLAAGAVTRDGVPAGAYAVVSDSDDVGAGRGRRVELPGGLGR